MTTYAVLFQYNVMPDGEGKAVNRPGYGHLAFAADWPRPAKRC